MTRRTLLWMVLFLLLFTLGLRVDGLRHSARGARLSREQGVYLFVRQTILNRYVEPVDEKKIFFGALQGMAEVLDPHSVFWPPDQYAMERTVTSGHFGGLGIEIKREDGEGLAIITPLAGTPASRAGLLPGDRIVKIDGRSIIGMRLEESSKLIRGEPDTPVKLTVIRKGAPEPLTFEIKRAVIKIDSVQEALILAPPGTAAARIPPGTPKIGYVQLAQFQDETAAEVGAALDRLEREGMRALILDLRQNPGGVLRAAVKVCDLFLSEGTIVSTRGRRTKASDAPPEVFTAQAEGTRPPYPIAVLIDAQSASASEIVAGCLKDHHRAVLVGQKSYGKGSVQSIFHVLINKGRLAALKLTTARYYTPSGASIDGKGIEPDFEVPFDLKQLHGLLLARRARRMTLNAPRGGGGNAEKDNGKDGNPDGEAARNPAAAFHDLQLEKAVEVLTKQLREAGGP